MNPYPDTYGNIVMRYPQEHLIRDPRDNNQLKKKDEEDDDDL